MNYAPICLFVYNRYVHTKKTIESLLKSDICKYSDIYIFSDGPKSSKDIESVKKVRRYINSIEGFKNIKIYESNINKGLANSVINGVTKIVNKYGSIIVIEDDLEFSNNFLSYMNEALKFYEHKQDIWSISGYTPNINIGREYKEDVYFIKRGCSWGWATWKNRWNSIDWDIDDYIEFKSNRSKVKDFNKTGSDMSYMLELQIKGEIDSWAIRWCYNQWKQQKYTVYPVISKIQNIGTDDSGTHSGSTKGFNTTLDKETKNIKLTNKIETNKIILKKFKNFYSDDFRIFISKYCRKLGVYKLMRKIYNKLRK